MKTKGRENMVKFAVISIVLAGLILFDLTVGTNRISLGNIFDYFFFPRQLTSSTVFTIKEFRLARVITAVVAGAALAVSGLLMQTIFRNPLAGPYVLGISNGAGLGVAVVVLGGSIWGFSHSIETSNWMILAASGLGAAAVLMLILAVSMRVKDVLGILISGVVASIVSIMQFFSNDVNVKSYVVWTMGSLDAVSFTESVLLIPICMSVALVLYMFSKPLNLMLLGESFATTMGVNIKLIRVVVFTGVSILTGAVTAFCGPLGFLGLAVPHISRWIFNTSNHFILIPASVILGAVFLLCGDILSHTMYAGGVLPINAIISVLGAPFIIWIVFKNQRTII